MKTKVLLSLIAMCFPLVGMAQSIDDDLYYTPGDKESVKKEKVESKVKKSTTVYAAPGTTVVVKDRKGNVRNEDEYNRRYDARDNDFSIEDDKVVIIEKDEADRGEWVNGFDGSQDDYEYAQRIVRFRNPRYAIPVSSPLYWDVVYGLNSWNWNVYDD
ncbi:MAG: hypothetical protein RSA44_05500, partial [Bacteroides sp.]